MSSLVYCKAAVSTLILKAELYANSKPNFLIYVLVNVNNTNDDFPRNGFLKHTTSTRVSLPSNAIDLRK